MIKPLLLLFIAALCILPGAAPGRATPSSGPLVILISASAHGEDQVAITYAKVVPHAQANRDLAALEMKTGWTLRHVQITDAPSSLARDKTILTGVECSVTHAVRPDTHGLAVQPFVQAFRAYRYIVLMYFVGPGFQFQGLHDYADQNVRIRLKQSRGAYTYQIYIRNPRFRRLNLPYLQPAATNAHDTVITHRL